MSRFAYSIMVFKHETTLSNYSIMKRKIRIPIYLVLFCFLTIPFKSCVDSDDYDFDKLSDKVDLHSSNLLILDPSILELGIPIFSKITLSISKYIL